jgi:hypothetical protein
MNIFSAFEIKYCCLGAYCLLEDKSPPEKARLGRARKTPSGFACQNDKSICREPTQLIPLSWTILGRVETNNLLISTGRVGGLKMELKSEIDSIHMNITSTNTKYKTK